MVATYAYIISLYIQLTHAFVTSKIESVETTIESAIDGLFSILSIGNIFD